MEGNLSRHLKQTWTNVYGKPRASIGDPRKFSHLLPFIPSKRDFINGFGATGTRGRCIQDVNVVVVVHLYLPRRDGLVGLIKKRKLQDRQIHLDLNYGTNKPLLVNETMGQEQRAPLEGLGAIALIDSAVSEFNGISLRRSALRAALSHRCMENASGER